MKVERVSYDVMTPSAARGILEAIYWHPGMKWIIDKIYICNPISFVNIRRNEVKSVASARTAKKVMDKGSGNIFISTSNDIQQRASLLLNNVHYLIEAHFDMTDKVSPEDNPGKFQDIIKRRVRKGQFYHQPYFGCREFPANFKLSEDSFECPEKLKGEIDLGYMLYDMDYTNIENIEPMFFRAIVKDGVLTVPPLESLEVLK